MSTKTLRKRIALVAVSAMGFGLMSVVVAPSASAAAYTASVTPVRVTFTGTALDTVPYAKISWSSVNRAAAADTAVLALTTAPTALAEAYLVASASIGASAAAAKSAATDASFTSAVGAKLGSNQAALAIGTQAAAIASGATTTSIMYGIAADVAGYYAGTITMVGDAGYSDTISFSFTTRGAVASVTPTVSTASTVPSGVSTLTVTLKDAAANTTQPLVVDSVTLAAAQSLGTVGTLAGSITSFASTHSWEITEAAAGVSLYDGVAAVVYTNSATAGSVATLTATPAGTMGAIAASSVTVTNDATIVGTGVESWEVVAPADVSAAGGSATVATASVRTGTAAVTVDFVGPVSSTLRFKLTSSAGTLNGATGTTAQYINVATDDEGAGEFSYTLGGAALLTGATSVALEVNGSNTSQSRSITLTQADAIPDITESAPDLSGSLVRTLGASTAVNFTVADQFGTAFGTGFTVRAYRTSNAGVLLGSATTDSSGTAALTVSPLSTMTTSGSSETYVYTIQGTGSATVYTTAAAANTTTIVYTTGGLITSSSTAVNNASAAPTTVLDSSAALYAAQTKYPVLTIPGKDGKANYTASPTQFYTVSTGTVDTTIGTASEMIKLTTDNTPDNTTTWTSDSGAFVSTSSAPAASSALTSVTVADSGHAYGFAHTVGLHTFTGTSGGKTTTVTVWVYNVATSYYNIAASTLSSSLTTGSNTVLTVTITDMYGNVINPAAGLVTATAAGSVRLAGQALTQSLTTSAAGTVSFTVIGDSAAGSGTITLAPTATGAQSWASTYVPVTGMAAPVKSVVLTYTITGATVKTVDQLSTELAAVSAALTAKIAADAAADAAAATAATAAAATAATAAAALAAKVVADAAATAAAIAAVLEAATAATDAATEAIDNGASATDSANIAAESADAATAAAQDAADLASEAGSIAQTAADTAAEALEAANAATDAANAAAESADAATSAALDAVDAANSATTAANAASDAVAALATQMATALSGIKAQITALTNLIVKIQKKVKA